MILTGHVIDVLRSLPEESVQCVVTSPPYWGLRAYGTEGQVWGGGEGHTITNGISTNPRRARSEVRCDDASMETLRVPFGWREELRGPRRPLLLLRRVERRTRIGADARTLRLPPRRCL